MIRDVTVEEAERLAAAVAQEVAPRLGSTGGDLRLLRVGASVLVALPSVHALLRIEPADRAASTHRQVAVARALAAAGVPAAHLAPVSPQPFVVDRWHVTAWELLDTIEGAAVDPAALGALAAALHRRTAGDVARAHDVPPFDPFAAIEAQLATAASRSGDDDPDVRLLRGRCAALTAEWAAAPPDPLGTAVVHGDLHDQNVVVTPTGLQLVDLELAGVGPPTYDLAAQLVAVERYGAPIEGYERFAEAYGFDLRSWEGAPVRTATYALWVTAWAVGHRLVSPANAAEATRRVAYWRDPDAPHPPWTLH